MRNIGNSDHAVVVARPLLSAYKSTAPVRAQIIVRSGKIADTVAALNTIDWSAKMPKNIGAQQAADALYNAIGEAQDRYQPTKILKLRG